MANDRSPVVITTLPEATRLAREVNETGKARLVQFDGAVVRLAPDSPARRRTPVEAMTPEEFRAGLHATFGSLKDLVDPDEFKRQRRELQVDDRELRSLCNTSSTPTLPLTTGRTTSTSQSESLTSGRAT